MKRRSPRNKPTLEHLEGRVLLHARVTVNGKPANDQDLRHFIIQQVVNKVPVSDRRIEYATPDNAHVVLTLYGIGSLKGSTISPDGVLDLVYSGTNASSGIVGKVSGGSNEAKLDTLGPGGTSILNLSGTGSTPIGPVNLKGFDLVDGGDINLTGGVGKLLLNSMGVNSQIHVKELTFVPPAVPGGGGLAGAGLVAGFAPSTSSGSSGSSSSSTSTSSTSTTSTSNVINLTSSPGGPGTATGVDIVVKHVNGAARSTPVLGDAQIFGYDPTANALVRFDGDTGAVLQTIPLVGLGTPISGVSMARDHGKLVALIGDGTTIQAFDATTGGFIGSFTTSNLSALGFNTVDGIGSTDFRTVITDASAGTNGLAALIDVGASLDSGSAVVVGTPFAPPREFQFTGGATGVAASETIYATGAAHFDSAIPDLTQFGIMSISTTGGKLSESSRAEVTSPKAIVNTGPPGTARANPTNALGSIDQDLALVTDSANTVTLYNPKTLTVDRTITLADPNRVTGLSESFHPEIAGNALVDVQGDVQTFRAIDAQGLLLNISGGANLIQISQASDSFVIGHPIQHVNIPVRSNVTLASTTRINTTDNNMTLGHRGGVDIVDPKLRVIGPLSLPND